MKDVRRSPRRQARRTTQNHGEHDGASDVEAMVNDAREDAAEEEGDNDEKSSLDEPKHAGYSVTTRRGIGAERAASLAWDPPSPPPGELGSVRDGGGGM